MLLRRQNVTIVRTHSKQLDRLRLNLSRRVASRHAADRLTITDDVTFVSHCARDVRCGYGGCFPVTFSCIPITVSDPLFSNVLRNSFTLLTSSHDASTLSMMSYLFNPEAAALNVDVYVYGSMTSARDVEEHLHTPKHT